MNQTNTSTLTGDLIIIAGRAVANAESFIQFQKDRPAVHRDALYDLKEVDGLFSFGRLRDVTRILIRATETASAHEDCGPAAFLALAGLAQWVCEERRRTAAEREATSFVS